jgi:hypothetical protein
MQNQPAASPDTSTSSTTAPAATPTERPAQADRN